MTLRTIAIVSPYKQYNQPRLTTAADSALNYYTEELAAALSSYCNVSVLAPKHNGKEVPWNDDKVQIIPAYNRGSAIVAAQIARAAMNLPYEYIHLQHELFAYGGISSALALPAAMAAMRLGGKRIFTTIHGILGLDSIDTNFVRRNGLHVPPTVARLLWRSLLRSVCSNSHIVHVHEELYKARLLQEYGVRSRIEVIPLGVSGKKAITAQERACSRDHFGIGRDAEVLLFFGYFAGYKGLECLLAAIPSLLKQRPKLTVIIAGEAPERLASKSVLRAQVDTLVRENHRVVALGFVPEEKVRTVFAASDVLILPYTAAVSASGPLAIAASYSTPVMVSSQLRTIIPDIPLSFQVSVADILSAVASFFDNYAIRDACREYINQFMRERSWRVVAGRLLHLYSSL